MDRDLDLDNNEKGGTDVLVVVDGRPAAVPALPDWLCVPRVPVNGKLQLIPHLQQQRLLRSQCIVYIFFGVRCLFNVLTKKWVVYLNPYVLKIVFF